MVFEVKTNCDLCRAFARDLIILALLYHQLNFYNTKNGFICTPKLWRCYRSVNLCLGFYMIRMVSTLLSSDNQVEKVNPYKNYFKY